jgi:hypothetical protein
MSPDLNLKAPDLKQSETKNISIEIESSPPFILAIARLFRAHKQPDRSVELCLQGLNNFPGNLGLRLEIALGYLDLKENQKGWAEITAMARELSQLAPTLELVADFSRGVGQSKLSEWFALLSQILAKYPDTNPSDQSGTRPQVETHGEAFKAETVPLDIHMAQPSSPLMENPGKDSAGEALHESKVLTTLNDWVTQLKENQT